MQERTPADARRLNSLIGKTFWVKCPDNDRYHRTVYIRHNPFTNSLQPMISNPVYGEPDPSVDEISAAHLQRIMRQHNYPQDMIW